MNVPLKQILLASRPISWINTAYPFAAGLILSGPLNWPLLLLGTLYFLFPYNLLMYGVNDIFDFESDQLNPRKGGIEGAKLDRGFHRWLGWSATALNIPFLLALGWLGTPFSNVVLGLVVFFVLAYSVPVLRFKERPLLDSVTSSLHFVGPLVYALSLTGFKGSWSIVVAAFFCWGMASHAFGAVQDVLADRAAGIGSIATVIGARFTVWLAAGLYAACGLLLATLGGWALAPAAVTLLYIANVAPYRSLNDADAQIANNGWRRFIWLNQVAGAVVTITLILAIRFA